MPAAALLETFLTAEKYPPSTFDSAMNGILSDKSLSDRVQRRSPSSRPATSSAPEKSPTAAIVPQTPA